MSVDAEAALLVLAMGLLSYAMRLAGPWLARRLPEQGRLRTALEAIPVVVLASLLAPMALAGGWAAAVAAAFAALAAARLPVLMVVAVGMAGIVVARMVFR